MTERYSDEFIKEVISFDPLSEAEKLTRTSYKHDTATTALGSKLHLANIAQKRAVLEGLGDTFLSNELPDYLRKIAEEGFIQVFEGSVNDPEMPKNKQRIFWQVTIP